MKFSLKDEKKNREKIMKIKKKLNYFRKMNKNHEENDEIDGKIYISKNIKNAMKTGVL